MLTKFWKWFQSLLKSLVTGSWIKFWCFGALGLLWNWMGESFHERFWGTCFGFAAWLINRIPFSPDVNVSAGLTQIANHIWAWNSVFPITELFIALGFLFTYFFTKFCVLAGVWIVRRIFDVIP